MRQTTQKMRQEIAELQRDAQEAIDAMQNAVDTDGCELVLRAVIGASRIGAAIYTALHEQHTEEEGHDVQALFAELKKSVEARKERPSVAILAVAALAEFLAGSVVGDPGEAEVPSIQTSEPRKDTGAGTWEEMPMPTRLIQ